jgi:hypothetical protein
MNSDDNRRSQGQTGRERCGATEGLPRTEKSSRKLRTEERPCKDLRNTRIFIPRTARLVIFDPLREILSGTLKRLYALIPLNR